MKRLRRLAAEGPTADDTVVMLDAHCSFTGLDDFAVYRGTPDEMPVT